MRHLAQTLCVILTTFVLGFASPSLFAADGIADRRVEYAMTKHDTIPVVFENGLGGIFSRAWEKVLPEISKDTTTFVYNRPGYGRSEVVSTPRDGEHVVDELRSLLLSKGLKPPYVLVGHSLGGLYIQYFARRYPEEVAALVLVDSTPPNAKLGSAARESWPIRDRLKFAVTASALAENELNGADATGKAVLGLPTFTGKPVIILNATQTINATEKRDLLRLYPGARQIWVDSGHHIPRENPEAVISAIREVLRMLGGASSGFAGGGK